MDAGSQERIGERNAAFREMNEHIEEVHERSQVESLRDLLCECGRDDCSERIFLSREEYNSLRSNPLHFAVASGHAVFEWGRVVECYEQFDVVEKLGVAAEVAEERDPRHSPGEDGG